MLVELNPNSIFKVRVSLKSLKRIKKLLSLGFKRL